MVCDIIEDALLKIVILKERFRAWKEVNNNEFEFVFKLHSMTAYRVKGIRKILKKWNGTAEVDRPTRNT